ALVRRDPWEEAFRLHLALNDPEHLVLQVDSVDPACIACPFRKFAGEEPRAAPEIEHPVTRLDVSFREMVRAVENATEPGIKVCSMGCGEYTVLVVFPGVIAGSHARSMCAASR